MPSWAAALVVARAATPTTRKSEADSASRYQSHRVARVDRLLASFLLDRCG